MNDTWVTLQGWVGADVERREAGGVPLATFRVASTPRHLKDGEWVDATTSWFTVKAWRALARNVAESVHKGDPVLVHGRLRAEVWEREGQAPSVTHVVEASAVGHDLSRGTGVFARAARREVPPADEQDATASDAVVVPEQRTSPEAVV